MKVRENVQLRRNQRDLELAQQIAHIGNWEMELCSREITGSKEFCRIFGFGEETELSEPLMCEVIHPDDLEPFYSEVVDARDTKRPFKFEGRIIRFDEELRYVWAMGIWLVNEADECTHVFGVVQDITERKTTEQELYQTRTLLQETINHLDIVLWARDFRSGRLLYMTEGTEKVFGISQVDAFNMSDYSHIVYPDDENMVKEKVYSGDQCSVEYRIVHPQTNEIRWIQTQVRPEKGVDGQISAIFGISVDVTERKRPEESMKAQNEVLSLIAIGKPLSEILGKIAELSNAMLPGRCCSILLVDQERQAFTNGASPYFPDVYIEAMINMPVSAMNNPSRRALDLKKPVMVIDISNDPMWEQTAFKQATEPFGLKSCWAFPVFSTENKVVAVYTFFSQKAGEPKAFELEMIEAFVHLTSLAIERKESERKIRKLAFYDSLTGLHNRSYFIDQLNGYMKEAELANQRFAVLYTDLDKFKWVNDSLGHDAGDQLLIEVASRMRCCVGDDPLVARLGGDEFTLLLKDVASVEEVLKAAQKMMDCFQAPFSILGHDIRVSLSIGISLYPDHGSTTNELMKHADTAMYQAKSEGRNKMRVYVSSYNDTVYERFVLYTQFHQALAENQFVLHYQPRVEMKTEKMLSAEALIRWDHPTMGFVPPDEFISMAEDSGFIVTLGEWVLREACRQNKAWQDLGLSQIRIAVNVSAQQFQQDTFVSTVNGILSETGLAPEWLEIEITESALMNHEVRMIAKLQLLNQIGVYVSVDDFGTGYSSLSYLNSFEVKALKIDRSFIRDLFNDSKDTSITKMMISLAHNLQMEVVAEGVETERQHEFLLLNGCEHAQGFLYCKPLTANRMEQKMKEAARIRNIKK
ncbi:EAL domain-containing protein [Cohnella sp.]|uniref:bifunctional diguanylate cyclase/phosphodiesterase n=1 Tax=Cohnella sp. TaxID=1883426 RepID=UPI003561AF63